MTIEKKLRKYKTYEEIGNMLNISTQQVHKIEKDTINKIIKRLLDYGQFRSYEILVSLSEELGVQPSQLFSKLNDNIKTKLFSDIKEDYGKDCKYISNLIKECE